MRLPFLATSFCMPCSVIILAIPKNLQSFFFLHLNLVSFGTHSEFSECVPNETKGILEAGW